MGDEIEKKPTWEERQGIVDDKVHAILDGNTPEEHVAASKLVAKDAEELHDLLAWYTTAYDAAVLTSDFETDTQISSDARTVVRQSNPDKWERIAELEKRTGVRNAHHQALANGSNASIIEATLRNKHFAF